MDTPSVTLARHAMATRFEIVLPGSDMPRLRAAGEAVLDEIERLERQLSLFLPSSELAHINARAAREPVRVEPRLFRLLERARDYTRETSGLFDITVEPLMACWGFHGGRGRVPDPETLTKAREAVGMRHIILDPGRFTVAFDHPGTRLDLGAIGKGYAIESAVELLRDDGVESALLHGGTSTIYGLGAPPGQEGWPVGIDAPPGPNPDPEPLARVLLRDQALSVSAAWGRSFVQDDRHYGHVIDPRTGSPAIGACLAAALMDSPTDSEVYSTALLNAGLAECAMLAATRSSMRWVVAAPGGGGQIQCVSGGIEVRYRTTPSPGWVIKPD